MGHLLQSPQCTDDLGLELVVAGDAGAPDAVVLDVLPHPLVGAELWGVGGQHEQPQPPVGGLDELLHGLAAVGGVAVDDQVDRPIGVSEELASELDEPVAVVGSRRVQRSGSGSGSRPAEAREGIDGAIL